MAEDVQLVRIFWGGNDAARAAVEYQTPGTSLLIRAAKLKSFCWHLTPLWDFADANFSHDITSSPYRYCSLPLSK